LQRDEHTLAQPRDVEAFDPAGDDHDDGALLSRASFMRRPARPTKVIAPPS
jgi:hypothetical protein